MGGAAGDARTGEGDGIAMALPPETNTGRSRASAADERRLIAGPPGGSRGQVYDSRMSIATRLKARLPVRKWPCPEGSPSPVPTAPRQPELPNVTGARTSP